MVSCNSGKKFNYSSAYKFSLPERYNSVEANKITASKIPLENKYIDTLSDKPEELLVSTEKTILLPKRMKPLNIAKTTDRKVSSSNELSTLTVKEIRKEIRVGFKKYRNEIKEKNKINGIEKTHDSSFVKGVVLVILGVAIIIGGIVVANNILWLGSVIAAIGLVLFLIGLLQLIL